MSAWAHCLTPLNLHLLIKKLRVTIPTLAGWFVAVLAVVFLLLIIVVQVVGLLRDCGSSGQILIHLCVPSPSLPGAEHGLCT